MQLTQEQIESEVLTVFQGFVVEELDSDATGVYARIRNPNPVDWTEISLRYRFDRTEKPWVVEGWFTGETLKAAFQFFLKMG